MASDNSAHASDTTAQLSWPLLVMGCHRCGTSAVARALGHLGLALPRNVMGAGRGNALGHWEPQAIVRFNDRLLAGLSRSWFDPKPLPDRWLEQALPHRGEAVALWEAERAPGGCVLKDPRFSRLGGFWREILAPAPVAVIACRNPYEVAASLKSRDGLDKKHGLLLWESYLLEAEAATRGLRRMVVHYHDLLKNPGGVLTRLADWARLAPGAAAIEAARASIEPAQAHRHESAEAFFARPKVQQPVKDLYRLLLAPGCLEDHDGFDRLRAGWIERWTRQSPDAGPSPQALLRPETHHVRSLQAGGRGDWDSALRDAQRAAELAPASALYRMHLGKMLMRSAQHDRAVAALRQALELDLRLTQARYHLIEALRTAKRPEEALAESRIALQAAHPGVPTLMLAAQAMADAKAYEDAAFTVARAVGLGGPTPEAALILANVLRRSGRSAEALGHLREAWRLAAARPDLRLKAIELMAKCGAAGEAAGLKLEHNRTVQTA